MDSDPKSPADTRLKVYEELVIWLQKQNAHKRLSFLDRPFVLTIIGGVAAALITAWWQASDKKHEMEATYQRAVVNEQLSLVKEFDAVYENTGGVVNSWFTRVIWMADETNKPKSPETEKNISEWRAKAHQLEERLLAAVPIDSVLIRIGVLYRCVSVKRAASDMITSWRKYEGTFSAFNQHWNEKQQLPQTEIEEAKASRTKMIAELQKSHDDLILRMAQEVSAGRESSSSCPP